MPLDKKKKVKQKDRGNEYENREEEKEKEGEDIEKVIKRTQKKWTMKSTAPDFFILNTIL